MRNNVVLKCNLKYARDTNIIIRGRNVLRKCNLKYARDANIGIKELYDLMYAQDANIRKK